MGIVCDLDGVIYRGNQPVPGAADAIARLRAAGASLLFFTNNSYPTLADYTLKLSRMGIPAEPDEVLTSAVVTAEVLAARSPGGAGAIVVGGEGLKEALRGRSIEPLDETAREADFVVVGYDPSFDYAAMRRATLALRAGAAFVATNTDATFPAPGGELWPGAGAILASLATASGRAPEVMGKPHRPMMDAAEARLAGAGRVVAVGDRPDTDLAGARAKGWTTVLVLSGVTAPEEVPSLDPPPDVVVEDISQLVPALPARSG